MPALCSLADCELVARLPALVQAERHAMVDVIEHLVEMERRRLYLRLSVSSLYRYCIERLGYGEDAALKRHRVAKLALRLPQVLDELRAGTIHLTGLFLLSTHLTDENATTLLHEARGKSRRQIEELIARWFPRSDVPPSLTPIVPEASGAAEAEQLRLGAAPRTDGRATCSKTGEGARARLEPLSPTRLRVEFTARAELYEKLEKARELLSHALPSGDLGELVERALDALIEQETRKRLPRTASGASKTRKARELKPGSRHVPVETERAVWERDNSQCTFVDGEGRRCPERRFLTLEHRTPFALGGPPTLENLCLLCTAHNLENARQVFGAPHIETKIRAKMRAAGARATQTQPAEPQPLETPAKVLSSLTSLGFARKEASAAVGQALASEPGLDAEHLLRKCLLLLIPKAG
jgi:5-methylcytosine-specific restriction endonuclease McrA